MWPKMRLKMRLNRHARRPGWLARATSKAERHEEGNSARDRDRARNRARVDGRCRETRRRAAACPSRQTPTRRESRMMERGFHLLASPRERTVPCRLISSDGEERARRKTGGRSRRVARRERALPWKPRHGLDAAQASFARLITLCQASSRIN